MRRRIHAPCPRASKGGRRRRRSLGKRRPGHVRTANGGQASDDRSAGRADAGGGAKLPLSPGTLIGGCAMSVLETPRLIFRGKVTWDPIVTNNRPAQYDEAESKTNFDSAATVAAFREAAIAAVVNAGNWNPHGTHRSTFFDTSIVRVDTGEGSSTNDPAVNSAVSFTGMLVDLEPYGAYSSQLFFDAMSFGIQGGCRVFVPRATRMTARYVN